jgi:hypothetical protein
MLPRIGLEQSSASSFASTIAAMIRASSGVMGCAVAGWARAGAWGVASEWPAVWRGLALQRRHGLPSAARLAAGERESTSPSQCR